LEPVAVTEKVAGAPLHTATFAEDWLRIRALGRMVIETVFE
jgi:hypothetical protein